MKKVVRAKKAAKARKSKPAPKVTFTVPPDFKPGRGGGGIRAAKKRKK